VPEIKALPVVKDELQQMAKTLSPDLWQKGSRQKNAATFANEGLHKTGSTIGRAALSTLSQKKQQLFGNHSEQNNLQHFQWLTKV
jgi:hypothetical protein